jgi:phosphonate transport system substrate-binding protein
MPTPNRRRLSLTTLAAIVCIAIAIAGGPARAWAKPFVFTAIPDDNEARLKERFDKVAAYLGKQLRTEVRYLPVKTYAASVAAFENDQVQMAWFGGLSGLQARLAVPGARAIAQGEEDRRFTTYFIANARTGLAAGSGLDPSLAGKTFTFGAKDSTSGRLMPEYFIRRAFGKPPERVFSRVGFSGDHSKTIALVQSGAYDVGAVNYTVWKLDVAQGKVDPSRVVVLWETPPYQDYQFTVRGDLDQAYGAGFTARLTKALLELADPDLLASFPRKAFVPARNEDYEQLRAVAKSIGLLD